MQPENTHSDEQSRTSSGGIFPGRRDILKALATLPILGIFFQKLYKITDSSYAFVEQFQPPL